MIDYFGLDENGVPIVPNVLVDLAALTAAFNKERDVNSGPGPGHNLRNYWVKGPGAAKINWKTPGDWTRCVRHLSKYVKDPKGLCSEYHHQATGMWPGDKRNPGMQDGTETFDTEMLYDGTRAAEGGVMTAAAAKTKKKQSDDDDRQAADNVIDNGPMVKVHETEDEVDPDVPADETDEADDAEEVDDEEQPKAKAKAAPVAAEMDRPAAWEGVLTVEGIESGDGRMFGSNALTWDELPLPLRWQKESAHGGQNDVTVSVGNIEKIWREPAPDGRAGVTFIKGSGTIDLGNPDGAEVYRRMKRGYMRGNSVDVDSVKGADVELVFPESSGETDKDEDGKDTDVKIFDMSRMQPELTIYKKGRIRATTLVEIPAFTEARLVLAVDEPKVPEETDVEEDDSLVQAVNDQIEAIVAAATTITVPDLPPREWFNEPTDVMATGALTVTAEGRIYGYVAPLGVRHRSFAGKEVTVPMRKVDYTRFMGGETIVADGGRVSTGAITMNCGHASTSPTLTASQAAQHYDNTCSMVATVRVGENRNGVWMAGALLPDVGPDQIRRIMASRLSGDWRAHLDKPGWREFVAALLVPVPGFPMARSAPSVTTSEGVLVASTVPIFFSQRDEELEEDEVEMNAKNKENCEPKTRIAAAAERIKAVRLEALRARVSQHMPSPVDRAAALRSRVVAFTGETDAFHGTHNQKSHGHRFGPGGELKSRVGKAADKVSKAKSEVNGGNGGGGKTLATTKDWQTHVKKSRKPGTPVAVSDDGHGRLVESDDNAGSHDPNHRDLRLETRNSADGPWKSTGQYFPKNTISRKRHVLDDYTPGALWKAVGDDDGDGGGSAKDRMKGAGPDGWKERKDGGFMKTNPATGTDHLIAPAGDGTDKWVHRYANPKGGVTGTRHSSKEDAMKDAERVIKRDVDKKSGGGDSEQSKLSKLSDREVSLLDGLHSGNGKAMLKDDAKLKEWADKWQVSEKRARELAQHLIDRDEAYNKDKMSAHDKKVADLLKANKGKSPTKGSKVIVDMNGTKRIVKVDRVKNGKVIGPTVDGLDELYFEDPTEVVKG